MLERHPQIGLLVCNAGVAARTRFLDGDPERIEQMLRVNYLGSLWTRARSCPASAAARTSS